MIIVVTGGRDYTDFVEVTHWIRATYRTLRTSDTEALNVWHGGATGADTCAETAAGVLGATSVKFAADWKTHGRKAGPMRNERMVSLAASHQRDGHTVVVLWFPGGRGTADCVLRAKKHGLRVFPAGFESLAEATP